MVLAKERDCPSWKWCPTWGRRTHVSWRYSQKIYKNKNGVRNFIHESPNEDDFLHTLQDVARNLVIDQEYIIHGATQ